MTGLFDKLEHKIAVGLRQLSIPATSRRKRYLQFTPAFPGHSLGSVGSRAAVYHRDGDCVPKYKMSQDQVFGFQPPSRLEAVAQYADEEENDCDHQSGSCSDSVAAVTPAD